MNPEITKIVNILHSVKTQKDKEKILEAYVNSVKQKAYYSGMHKSFYKLNQYGRS